MSPRPTGLSLQENLDKYLKEGKQMTAMNKTLTGAPYARRFDWKSINWKKVRKQVKYMQVRIAKAFQKAGSARAGL